MDNLLKGLDNKAYYIDIDSILDYCFPKKEQLPKEKETTEIYEYETVNVGDDDDETIRIPQISQKIVREVSGDGSTRQSEYQYDLLKQMLGVLLDPMENSEDFDDSFPFSISFNTFVNKGFIKELKK